jgi:hypothetical protein
MAPANKKRILILNVNALLALVESFVRQKSMNANQIRAKTMQNATIELVAMSVRVLLVSVAKIVTKDRFSALKLAPKKVL